jgi:hypothetical protein
MKQRKTRRRTLRSKRSRRSRKASRKRYTRGGYATERNATERIGFGGINYTLLPNSNAPGPDWSFRFVSPTENVPLHRMGANMMESVVRRRDDRGWDVYSRFYEHGFPDLAEQEYARDEEPRAT